MRKEKPSFSWHKNFTLFSFPLRNPHEIHSDFSRSLQIVVFCVILLWLSTILYMAYFSSLCSLRDFRNRFSLSLQHPCDRACGVPGPDSLNAMYFVLCDHVLFVYFLSQNVFIFLCFSHDCNNALFTSFS